MSTLSTQEENKSTYIALLKRGLEVATDEAAIKNKIISNQEAKIKELEKALMFSEMRVKSLQDEFSPENLSKYNQFLSDQETLKRMKDKRKGKPIKKFADFE